MLTAEGFKRKTYEEYIAELEQQAKELFGANVNLSENGPMGKWIRMQAYGRAEESELTEQVYLSAFVDHAEGISLDYVVKGQGMGRQQAAKAVGTADLTVTTGATIPAGVIVATEGGVEFVTTADAVDSDNDGIASAPIEARIAGIAGNVPANTITVINTPVIGLQSVNNPTATAGGRETETDKELRDRHADIGASSLSSTTKGIRATVLQDVPDVTSVIVIENNNDIADSDGRPAHSFETVVYGGTAEAIGQAVLKAKPAGIRAYGSTSVLVKDDAGVDQTIGFSFAASLQIFVNAAVTTNSSFPSDGAEQIKLALLRYIGGEDAQGNKYVGLGMGEDVVNTQAAFAVIRNVPGVDDITITFSTDGTTYAGGNIAVSANQVAQTTTDKLAVS